MCSKCTIKSVVMLAGLVSGDPKLARVLHGDPTMKQFEKLLNRLAYEQTQPGDHLSDGTCDAVASTRAEEALVIIGLVGPWMHALADMNTLMVDVIREFATAGHPRCVEWMKAHEKQIIDRTDDPTENFGGLSKEPLTKGPIAPPVKGGLQS